MTLRARLTIALVILVGVGLIVADVATYTALRSFLLQRVDQQLRSSPGFALGALANDHPGGFPAPDGPKDGGVLPSGTFAAVYDASGATVTQKFFTYGGTTPEPPALPSSVGTGDGPRDPFTVGSVGGGLRYRALAAGLGGSLDGYTIVVAIPLTETSQTLQRLLVIAGLVTLAVLAAMALISWWTVRRGLRPLEEIEVTAGAIAAGDLSRRVDDTDPRTEVGRLGVSLNVMLSRIEEAMDERRASEEALRRFLADASHELRTPLTSIRGYAELFRRGASASPDDTALAMRRIEEESERMGLLVGDLLFLARAGQGRPVAREPVDLARLTDDAVRDARAVDPSRGIDLDVPETLTVQGDEPRLRQVLGNLLSNALTHTPDGTPVSVRLTSDGDRAELSVSDRGPGLPADEAAHVFEPFFRADPSRGRASEGVPEDDASGTGLGLAIVAAIAEAHGGSVSVSSEPGAGATFTVRLPLAPVAATAEAPG